MKFWEIYRFEFYYQTRRLVTWVYFIVLIGLILLVLDEVVEYLQNVEVTTLHAPITVAQITGFSNKFGLLLTAALVGDGAMRDIQARMDPLLYTTPLKKTTYLGARFLGTFSLVSISMLLALPLGLLLAKYIWGLTPAVFGPFRIEAYVSSGLFFTVPNAFVSTAILYAMVLVSRQAMAAYLGALLLFLLSTFSADFITGHWELRKLLDPSGITVLDALSRTLTPLQKNAAAIALTGDLLVNRVLWLSVSMLIGFTAFFRFKIGHDATSSSRKITQFPAKDLVQPETQSRAKNLAVVPSFSLRSQLYQVGALVWQFFTEFIKSPTGFAIPVLATVLFIALPKLAEGPLDVSSLLTTNRVIILMNHPVLKISVFLLITVLAGQLVWRERDTRMNEISDVTPTESWVLLLSKFLTVGLALVALQVTLMVAAILVQLKEGYFLIDIGEYLWALMGTQLIGYLLFAAVALALHIIINQKYIAHLGVVFFYAYTLVASRFGIEHSLLIFNSDAGRPHYLFEGQSLLDFSWLVFKLYWAGWAFLLLIIAQRMWVRGMEEGVRKRFSAAINSLKSSSALGVTLVLILFTGGIIFYNTNILNTYLTEEERTEQQVAYEHQYGRYKDVPQPHLISTKLQVEFYPDKTSAVVKGIHQLKNSTGKEIDSIHLALAAEVETTGIKFSRKANLVLNDKKLRHQIYVLAQPLKPNETIHLVYVVRFKPNGFTNRGVNTSVVKNGSYFKNSEWLPAIGYQSAREVSNNSKRKEYGLPKKTQVPNYTDAGAVLERRGRERISFEVTIGTVANQIAVAPGALKKKWTMSNRQYFHYVADSPMLNMYHIYSAEYSVRRSRWRDKDIFIFHQPQTTLTLDRMAKAINASLAYYTENFGPYPFSQLTFIEYPDSGTGAISLPGTIGFSTNFALLNPSKDSRKFDLTFAVAAHEIAHQWWAHQLVPAEVEGAPLITESLAWYSALGVVEQTYGAKHLQHLLDAMRQEYLNPRSRAGVPLLRATEGFQAYRRGPFTMYALREYIGKKKVNQALRNLLKKFNPAEPPFATSLDFYKEIQSVTPDSLQYLLKDLFELNTYWELETKEAKCQQMKDGGWEVTLDVFAKKVQVDEAGTEQALPMHDLIEIGVFGSTKGHQKTLYQRKHRIKAGENKVVVKVYEKPEKAGIDPRHLLIDTSINDNVIDVEGQ